MMSESSLSAKLLSLFQSMHDDPMSEKDYADNLAKIITDHIKTAEVQAGIKLTASGNMGQVAGSTIDLGKIQ